LRTDDSVLDELEQELAQVHAAAPRQVAPSKLRTILLVVLVTVLNAFGNLLLAKGMKGLPAVGFNPIDYITAMINPYVASGIILLILWLLTRMTLLSWADLTFSLPLMALGYVIAPILGHFVLHEQVNTAQWIGTALIFAGCGLVGTTAHKHEGPHS
jgi:drug/metabolite transporter (DMT)-like permease